MWRPFTRFSEQDAQTAGPGRHAAGRGLWLCRAPDGSATWELCLTIRRERRDMKIGEYPEMDVRSARKIASQWRGLARNGLDPAVEQEAVRNAAARNLDQFYC